MPVDELEFRLEDLHVGVELQAARTGGDEERRSNLLYNSAGHRVVVVVAVVVVTVVVVGAVVVVTNGRSQYIVQCGVQCNVPSQAIGA